MITLIVFLIFLAILVFLAMGGYNSLIRMKNQVDNSWAQVDVQLKRRHDLIPNLVSTVKGYAAHEKETLEAVIAARNAAAKASGVKNRAAAESGLEAVLGRLFALSEAYPDLKANQNFLALQEELTSTENKVSFSRQFYNDSVMNYNNKIGVIPTNIIASIFNFTAAEFFEVSEPGERDAPTVKF